MIEKDWLTKIKKAKKTCIVENNMKKVHFLLDDMTEMAEEYNMETNVLTRRAWRIKNEFGNEGTWQVEIGDPDPITKDENFYIKESKDTPFVSRRVTKFNLEWRIRNLPYPIEVYSVIADPNDKCLIVKTSNKKYFKKLQIPDLERIELLPDQKYVQFSHKFNTLIITYKKPTELLNFEKALIKEILELKPRRDGDMDCKPS